MSPSATRLAFLAIELFCYVLMAVTLRHAWRVTPRIKGLSRIACTVLFAYAIEFAFTHIGGSNYVYGEHFLLYLPGNVPLCIILGWGVVVYAAMQTSDLLAAPFWLCPIIDGLLASNIDFALDPIAVATGYWTWLAPGKGPNENYFFGVPWDNYLGWFMIVGGFSLCIRLAYRYFLPATSSSSKIVLVSAAAMVPAIGIVLGGQHVLDFMYAHLDSTPTFMLIYGSAFAAYIWFTPRYKRDNPPDWTIISIPIAFHLILMIIALAGGIFALSAEQHILVVFMPVLGAFGVVQYLVPYADTMFQRRGAAQTEPAG